MAKFIGNLLYRKTIADKTRHRRVKYVTDIDRVSQTVRSRYFSSIDRLEKGVYEVTSFKKQVNVNARNAQSFAACPNWFSPFFVFQFYSATDVPWRWGLTILQRAKLMMLEYHYDCLEK